MSYVLPKAVIAAMLVGGMAMPASAAMTVGTFLARANALRDQGPMALMSPDFPALKAEAKAATTQLKAGRPCGARRGRQAADRLRPRGGVGGNHGHARRPVGLAGELSEAAVEGRLCARAGKLIPVSVSA
jgi:hypothetical protein